VTGELVVRSASASDRRDILDLLARTLGWNMDERDRDFFAWKHERNVFGSSPAWVARDGDRLAGFRTFLRWEFEQDGATVRAVRAVDTATDRAYERRGVFRRLTLDALDKLRADGTAFVFNTPNERSRSGYVRMGWQTAGRIPLAARPTGFGGAVHMAGARVPADLWSAPDPGGEPVPAVLEDEGAIAELLDSLPRRHAMATRRSVHYLRWRYGFPPLDYRAALMPGGVASGVALFRVRRRGAAREAALCEVLAPGGDTAGGRSLVREVARVARADYVLRVATARDGCVPLPRQGPILTTRSVERDAPDYPKDWALALGDVELL
jgi:GNAT superfamily N-acetyltransferase